MDSDFTQATKFANELEACFKRWTEESDLDLFEMTAVACDVLNELCGETTIEFESDIDEL